LVVRVEGICCAFEARRVSRAGNRPAVIREIVGVPATPRRRFLRELVLGVVLIARAARVACCGCNGVGAA